MHTLKFPFPYKRLNIENKNKNKNFQLMIFSIIMIRSAKTQHSESGGDCTRRRFDIDAKIDSENIKRLMLQLLTGHQRSIKQMLWAEAIHYVSKHLITSDGDKTCYFTQNLNTFLISPYHKVIENISSSLASQLTCTLHKLHTIKPYFFFFVSETDYILTYSKK